MLSFPILFQDEHFFAIDKPAGFFVHPPERSEFPVASDRICLNLLRTHFQRPVYPVHRLDGPTSGLVLFAFCKEATRSLSALFRDRQVEKTYHAVVRGFVEEEGRIELPLEIKGFEGTNACETRYRTLARLELPFQVSRYPTSRYSLLEVRPITGRWHQIRRHFDRVSHPLVGDVEHGDSHHNRFFRDQLGIKGLCLRAHALSFIHPWTNDPFRLTATSRAPWDQISRLFSMSGAENFSIQREAPGPRHEK